MEVVEMSKNQHTLYIDDDKFAACKERGINLSLTLNSAVDRLMSDEDFDYTLHLDYIGSTIKAEEDRLSAINEERKEIDKRLKTLKAEYRRVARQYKLEEDSIAISKLLAALNSVIRGSKYDINIVNIAAKEILVQIYKLRYDFDLKKHIELLEDTNSD